jgi:aminopeptidase N
MKKSALIAILILAVSLPSSGQAVDWSKKALQSERSRSYDALHYLVKIKLDLDQKAFEGAATVTVASFREGLATCVLDAEEFTVTSVLSEDGLPLKFDQTAKELAVHLLRPYKFGEELSFTCFYHGQDPKIGLQFMPETADNPQIVFSDSFPENVHH